MVLLKEISAWKGQGKAGRDKLEKFEEPSELRLYELLRPVLNIRHGLTHIVHDNSSRQGIDFQDQHPVGQASWAQFGHTVG